MCGGKRNTSQIGAELGKYPKFGLYFSMVDILKLPSGRPGVPNFFAANI